MDKINEAETNLGLKYFLSIIANNLPFMVDVLDLFCVCIVCLLTLYCMHSLDAALVDFVFLIPTHSA